MSEKVTNLLEEIKDTITECIMKLKKIRTDLSKYNELEKYKLVIDDDINGLTYIYDHANSWDETYVIMQQMNWKKWPVDKKITIDLKNEAKEIRDKIKEKGFGASAKESAVGDTLAVALEMLARGFSFKNIDDKISVNIMLVLSIGVTLLTVPKSSALK